MIKGMTGFGSAQLANGNVKAVVEIKSLNHRYFDINYYLPTGFASAEDKIRQMIQKKILRGRVTVSIKITQKPQQKVVINKQVVQQHLKNVQALRREFKVPNDVTVSDILKLPGVLDIKETMVEPKMIWTTLEKSIKRSLAGLVTMRAREGRSLAKDVRDKLTRMSVHINKIKARSKTILREKKKILTPEEFQSFQKSNDINEEISRLQHYVTEIKGLLRSTVSIGKKIDFIAQEMQRETNTIGSKLQDKVVSNAVIALKSKVEKIREQAQNIE